MASTKIKKPAKASEIDKLRSELGSVAEDVRSLNDRFSGTCDVTAAYLGSLDRQVNEVRGMTRVIAEASNDYADKIDRRLRLLEEAVIQLSKRAR